MCAVGEPARRYSWPPFEAGNAVAVKHGAASRTGEGTWRPVAERLVVELAEVAPWTTRPAFGAAAWAWARAEAKVMLVSDWLDERGLLTADGEPRPAATFLERLEARAANARERLGLDPQAFVRLFTALTASPSTDADALDALRAEGRRILEAREAG